MTEQLELRLVGAAAPDGEIRLSDLAAIAASLQELSLRITRASVASEQRGRPTDVVSELSQLRLTGVSKGSTVLLVSRGAPDVLDIEPAELHDQNRMFAEVIEAVGMDHRPEWVTDSVADSADQVVKALKDAAPRVEARFGQRAVIQIDTLAIHRETWRRAGSAEPQSEVLVSGRLEAVDLRSGKFRIIDDVGNRLALEDVPDAEAVAHLITERVSAFGGALRGADERLRGLQSPLIVLETPPESWQRTVSMDLTEELSKPGPTHDGGIEVTDDEYADFVAFIKS